jgi:ribonuclease J
LKFEIHKLKTNMNPVNPTPHTPPSRPTSYARTPLRPGPRPYRRSSSFSAKKDGPASGLRPSHFSPVARNGYDTKLKEAEIVPPLASDSIRIIPLGGVEEIGKNCTMIEVGDDIIVIDIGFQFKDENTPGIDYILPNTKYVEERKEKVRAVIITHGHLDHIGAIPFVMPRIGNPPLYTRLLTSVMIKKRQEEFLHMPPLDLRVIEKNDTITVGKLKVKFFSVTHTIPDAHG